MGETDETNDEQPKRSLGYFDDLRNSNNVTYETRPDSAVFLLNTTNETLRLAHVVNLNPYSEMLASGRRVPVEVLVYVQTSMFLGLQHFNERSSTVLPHLPDLLGDCNLYMTMDIQDTLLSPIVACGKALSYSMRPRDVLQYPLPVAFGGAARSAVSQPLSVLTGVFQVPQVNGASTSSTLDNKETSPTFIRTVPTNRLDAEAFIMYLKHLEVTHFAVLFVRDSYGSEFNRELMDVSSKENIVMESAAYDDGDESSIIGALQKLQKTQFRYFFAILTPAEGPLKFIFRQALDLGMFGNPDYVWLFGEASTRLTEPTFYSASLNSSLESDREIAASLNGAGVILLDIPANERYDAALRDLGANKELFEYFLTKHV
jgi:hypothetical protein